ncbi:hypothetical protein FXV77_07020 [Sphingobacterium phlebotomi]|uniref:Helix-turn-helix domain-containing protein n=1 Tax=Sphingobacterium phlebotomi TaxID=2605433 RepID=A0A5D4H8N1_9SPHI|nr:hypothetical protein [Sphingobacterium phlebotomi]TYR36924.1 hypothetical protein FXV77_07020 [Sphingobacterium phlebotomi]
MMLMNVLRDIFALLQEIYWLMKAMVKTQQHLQPSLIERKLWSKQEIMDKLGMSETTYKRHLKSNLLRPIRLGGTDLYFEEDIVQAMEESRRKGRI